MMTHWQFVYLYAKYSCSTEAVLYKEADSIGQIAEEGRRKYKYCTQSSLVLKVWNMQDGVSKAKKQRQYDKLPVIICEWHQQVLPHIHRAIATRYLPENGLKMLHFDSHPDLTFPINLPAEECFKKESLYEEVEIADWILPLVYEGHLDHVVWIKPPWANQIKDGDWAVSVGENKENQFLRLTFFLIFKGCWISCNLLFMNWE